MECHLFIVVSNTDLILFPRSLPFSCFYQFNFGLFVQKSVFFIDRDGQNVKIKTSKSKTTM